MTATEFAYILRLFGKDVLWLPRSAPLHRTRFTPQARAALASALARHAIETRPGAELRAAAPDGPGVYLTLTDGTQETVDWLPLGTGRRPNTAQLDLETAGIETDAEGRIARDEYLCTAEHNVYAIGDCAGREMTANQALDDGAAGDLGHEPAAGFVAFACSPTSAPTISPPTATRLCVCSLLAATITRPAPRDSSTPRSP